MGGPRITELDWKGSPLALAAAWPADQPLIMLHSGRAHRQWARWSILATPRAVLRLGDRAVRTGAGVVPGCTYVPSGDAAADLQCLDGAGGGNAPVPFVGGWIGYLGYDLGHVLEPASRRPPGGHGGPADDRRWPTGELAWCPDALVHDNAGGRWFAVGDVPKGLDGSVGAGGAAFAAGALTSASSVDAYLDRVARTIEYIAAGDVFQVNITHRLTAPFEGSTRHLALRALALSGAWYGAYLELPDGRCVVSMSPELFLDLDGATGRVVTRPIKGTRPSDVERSELAESAKDTAELTMIVDLMRNDLGRVCEFGSVRVPRPRAIETHPTVHHGVAEVKGRLRADVAASGLLRATFPGGSVTGAPKIRAMQIIDELEAVRRGPYCGAVGFASTCGRAVFNVAIRTAALTGERRPGAWGRLAGVLDYGVGGGIVADSQPLAEYRESMDKAAILKMVLEKDTGSLFRRQLSLEPSIELGAKKTPGVFF